MNMQKGAVISEGSSQMRNSIQNREAGSALQPYQKTFRVQGIPHNYNRKRTEEIIKAALSLEAEGSSVKVYSLAFNPYRQAQEKVATVSFTKVPNCLSSSVGKDVWQFPLQTSGTSLAVDEDDEDTPSRDEELVIDTHFRGFTPLRSFQKASDHRIDCIAISGLGGHAFGSFKERGGTHMWLRDSLPHDLPGVRILVYGYDTRLASSESFQNVRTLAGQFRDHIKVVRAYSGDDHVPKPLLFIGHSLGGLIVKQALIQMREGNGLDKAYLRATYGALFFGVPNQGMDISSLVPMVGDQPNRHFLESLGKESETLQEQKVRFPKAFDFRDSEIISFFETKMSPTAEMRGDKWSMTGIPTILVDSASATHSRPWEFEDRYVHAINRNHSDLVKFTRQDEDYEVVLHHLHRFSSVAVNVVRGRFKVDSASTLSPELAGGLQESKLVESAQEVQEPRPVDLTHEQQRCLKSLAFPEIHDREHDIKPQANNTCAWLLKHGTFLEWLSQRCGLLWIRGKPGAGKSTVLKYALQETTQLELPQHKLLVASHFFHGRGTKIQKVPLGLFRTLLHQLWEKVPNMLPELNANFMTKLKSQGESGKDWNWHPMELQKLLASSLLTVGKVYTIRIFVDALDECGEEAAVELAKYFQRLISASSASGGSLSICFSCRHYPIMTLESGFEICVEHENYPDIETYIQNELQSIQDQAKTSILRQQITARAFGSFQWVTLVVPRVCQLHRKGNSLQIIQSHIRKIPAELNSLYRELLQSIEEESVAQSLQLMQWICFATRPLTVDELRHAIAVDADTPYKSLSECRNSPEYADTQEEMECRLKDLCRGLAETKEHEDDRVVQFIHQSVNDFLLEDGLRILDNSSESIDKAIGRAHFRLSRSCIKYIAMEEVGHWVYQMKQKMSRSKAVPVEILFLEYAARQLFSHIKMAETKEIPQYDILNCFQWPSNEMVQRWAYTCSIINPYADGSQHKGATLLHIASSYGLLSVLTLMLDNGADVESRDSRYGQTPLSWAAGKGHKAVVKLLLEKGVNVDSKDNYGRTPLWLAAENGHEAVVKLLLEKEVDVDSEDIDGWTPLSLAVEHGHDAVVKPLLKEVVSIKTVTAALLIANMNGHHEVIKLLEERIATYSLIAD